MWLVDWLAISTCVARKSRYTKKPMRFNIYTLLCIVQLYVAVFSSVLLYLSNVQNQACFYFASQAVECYVRAMAGET